MTKSWSTGFSPQEFDENYLSFKGIYLSEAGVVYFYTRKGEIPKSIELVQARFIEENKGSWESKVIITLENVKDLPEVIITQNKDKGFIIAASDYLQTRLITNKVVKVLQLDPMLNSTYKSDIALPEKSHFWNIFQDTKFIYLLFNSTPTSTQKVISIKAKSNEVTIYELWPYIKGGKNKSELILKYGFLQYDQNNNSVLCMKITNTNANAYFSLNGFGFVTFNSEGEVVSNNEVKLPDNILEGEKVIYDCDLESFEILNDNSYKINLEDNWRIYNLEIKDGKIEKSTTFSRITAIHDDVNVYYTKQIMVGTRERTRFLYNKTATSIGSKDEYKKDFWNNVRGIYAEIDDNGLVKEKDLKIEIGGEKNCQIQTTQAIVLENKDVITVVAPGEDLYMVKIYLNKLQ